MYVAALSLKTVALRLIHISAEISGHKLEAPFTMLNIVQNCINPLKAEIGTTRCPFFQVYIRIAFCGDQRKDVGLQFRTKLTFPICMYVAALSLKTVALQAKIAPTIYRSPYCSWLR